jgi:excisionase family DNA binding protein
VGVDTGAGRGYTPAELARLLRVNADRVRGWIKSGRLGAVDLGDKGRPRFVVLPHHVEQFTKARAAGPPPRPARRRRQTTQVDYYPD